MGTGGVRYIVHDVDAAIDFYRQHLGEPDKRLERELLVAVRKYGPGSDEVDRGGLRSGRGGAGRPGRSRSGPPRRRPATAAAWP